MHEQSLANTLFPEGTLHLGTLDSTLLGDVLVSLSSLPLSLPPNIHTYIQNEKNMALDHKKDTCL